MLKETKERMIFIIITLPLILFFLWFNFYNFLFIKFIIILINFLAFNELFNFNKENKIIKLISFLFIFLLYLPFILNDYFNIKIFDKFYYLILFSLYFLIISVYNIFKYKIKNALFDQIYIFFSLIYSSLSPFLIFNFYRYFLNLTFYCILFFLLIVWSSNSFAYIVGMGVKNRHPLNLPVSPNKSSEGFLGAIIFGTLVPFILYLLFFNAKLNLFSNNYVYIMVFIFFVNIFSIIGDLFESMIKRYFEVKDSSNLFKGHGGILDIIDSILFAFPFYYFILMNFK